VPTIQQIAEAFSRHQFTDSFAHLAADVRWVSVGESILEGRDAVIQACDQSSIDLAQVSTEFARFRSIVGTDAVAVDTVGRYTDSDQQTSVVSSCDIYEFEGDTLTMITSYAVELEPTSP
jgi:SnoaL-like domain